MPSIAFFAHTLRLIFSSPHCSTSFEMIGSCKPSERANEKPGSFIAVPLQFFLLCLSLKLHTSSPSVAEPLCSDFDSPPRNIFRNWAACGIAPCAAATETHCRANLGMSTPSFEDVSEPLLLLGRGAFGEVSLVQVSEARYWPVTSQSDDELLCMSVYVYSSV